MTGSHSYRWTTDRQALAPKEAFMEPANELVYIVDDEASVGEVLSTLLRANGKRAQIFTSGQNFLGFARRDFCACLILDLTAERNKRWTVPVGGGAGKLFKIGPQLLNARAEYFNDVRTTTNGSDWQLQTQLQFLFIHHRKYKCWYRSMASQDGVL
ncbi:MAG TPA: hypothetical protein VGF96_12290 [Terracidiphilus sp.]|jgi:hypothetical protein